MKIDVKFNLLEENPVEAFSEAVVVPGGGFPYKIGTGLKVTEENTLEVDSAENFNGDNDRPASASLVKTQLGNIEAILATI